MIVLFRRLRHNGPKCPSSGAPLLKRIDALIDSRATFRIKAHWLFGSNGRQEPRKDSAPSRG